MPEVSVIIPHFNRGVAMGPTLASLAAQSFRDWELIVVDDASADDPSPHVWAHVPQARIVRLDRNSGPSAARNRGIDDARGRFVAFLDSDDIWAPGKLAAQVAAVKASGDPQRQFCATLTRIVDGAGGEVVRPRRPVARGERFDEFLFVGGEFSQTSSIFLAKEAAARIRFPEDLRQYEDYAFFIRAGAAGMDYLLVQQPLVTWHNDAREDRLGRSDDLGRAQAFMARVGDAMSARSRLAFQLRYLGVALFRQDAWGLCVIAMSAVRQAAVRPRDVALLAAKLVLPDATYRLLRRKFHA